MSIKAALQDHLKQDGWVSRLVDRRVYRDLAPSSASLPYVTIHRRASEASHNMTAAANFARSGFDVRCWASGDAEAEALGRAVRESLDGMGHQMLGTGDVARAVNTVHAIEGIEMPEGPRDASEQRAHGIMVDVTIWHPKTVPTFV